MIEMKENCAFSMQPLSSFLTEYKELNGEQNYRPVAVGRYGIRTRESIYSKELAKDYSKNKVIRKNTLTVGMGSVQMDIGVLTDDVVYSVSPAYHTYQISDIDCDYLRFCLQARNNDMFLRYMKRGSRQGKSIDLNAWIKYQIPVYDESKQSEIGASLQSVQRIIEQRQLELQKLDDLVKARFVEMFGDPVLNSKHFDLIPLGELGVLKRGVSKHRPRNDAILLGGNYPLIQTGDVSNAKDYITDYNATYSEEGLKQSKMWHKGTLCITIAANIADTAILGFDACFPDSVVGFIPGERVTTLFVHNWFKFLQPILEENAPAVAQKNLNVATLEKTDVIVPPIELQNEFEVFIKQLDKSKFVNPIRNQNGNQEVSQ